MNAKETLSLVTKAVFGTEQKIQDQNKIENTLWKGVLKGDKIYRVELALHEDLGFEMSLQEGLNIEKELFFGRWEHNQQGQVILRGIGHGNLNNLPAKSLNRPGLDFKFSPMPGLEIDNLTDKQFLLHKSN